MNFQWLAHPSIHSIPILFGSIHHVSLDKSCISRTLIRRWFSFLIIPPRSQWHHHVHGANISIYYTLNILDILYRTIHIVYTHTHIYINYTFTDIHVHTHTHIYIYIHIISYNIIYIYISNSILCIYIYICR